MLARRIPAALACRPCQSSILLRAAVVRPISSGFPRLPKCQTRPLPIRSQRFFSQDRIAEPTETKKTEAVDGLEDSSELAESLEADDVPWFLEVEPPTHPPSQHAVQLPKIPEGAPPVLEPMIKYIFEDMGLDNISLLDLRDLDPPAALGPNLIMLFGTARSERHLHVSSGRLVRWLKRNHKIGARADGLIGPGELRTKLRRLRKKAKLLGTNTAIIPGGDNGISTGWVCVNFSPSQGKSGEVESFDESGRFSGFGASMTGTTVVVQCMTEARRHELDLETLWQGILKRNLQATRKVQDGKAMETKELEDVMASKIQLPTSPSELQWQAMKAASQQKRYFSTSARRLAPYTENSSAEQSTSPGDDVVTPSLKEVSKLVTDIQLQGLPFAQTMMYALVRDILRSPSEAAGTAAERLSLVDQLLKTAEERGLSIWDKEMFVSLTEAIYGSSAYGPELQRAKSNLDYLAASRGWQFSLDHIFRLMEAYALRHDWDRFWDAFRMPSRFRVAREPRHYELAYWTLAQTRSQKMCISNLRWIYPEMKNQDPPVHMLGSLYESLKSCIKVADPQASFLLEHGIPAPRFPDKFYIRRMKRREFLRVLAEVEFMHGSAMSPVLENQEVRSLV